MINAEIALKLERDVVTHRPSGTRANIEYVLRFSDELNGRLPSEKDMFGVVALKMYLFKTFGIRTTLLFLRRTLQRIARDRSPIHP